MNLAVLHYHLGAGGVTRVIANHLLSLAATARDGQRLRVMLLFDGQQAGWPDDLAERLGSIELLMRPIPSLGYQQQPDCATEPMLDQIRPALAGAGFRPDETVLHAHNHSLGKNVAYPAALRQLAEEDGFALLLQPHDFAEDFRPSGYRTLRQSFDSGDFSAAVYFQGPRVHYATLNRRDFDVLNRAGIARDRLHFLPNPVPELPPLPARTDAREALERAFEIDARAEYVLYPVRGIRRKNLGEFVLLSILRNEYWQASGSPRSSVFGVTLDPQNPVALPYYEHWKTLAGELDLPCRFGVGTKDTLSFPENLAAADLILTTSVAEGFGMVFLESWLAGRGLVGRNLPEVTSDFTETGLQLDALYDRLDVPIDWIGRDVVAKAVHEACRHVYADYGLAVPTSTEVARAVERSAAADRIDFGSLDESLQELIIRRIAGDAARRRVVLDANPVLRGWDDLREPTIATNQSVIRRHYSLDACGQRLWAIYDSLLGRRDNALDAPADGEAVRAAFLDLDRFRLIRT